MKTLFLGSDTGRGETLKLIAVLNRYRGRTTRCSGIKRSTVIGSEFLGNKQTAHHTALSHELRADSIIADRRFKMGYAVHISPLPLLIPTHKQRTLNSSAELLVTGILNATPCRCLYTCAAFLSFFTRAAAEIQTLLQ